MDLRLRYFDGCPNWRTTLERLHAALEQLQLAGVHVVLERVESAGDAERLRFVGSPTILVGGKDVFPSTSDAFGLTCRVDETPDGLAGSPTTEQIVDVLTSVA